MSMTRLPWLGDQVRFWTIPRVGPPLSMLAWVTAITPDTENCDLFIIGPRNHFHRENIRHGRTADIPCYWEFPTEGA